MKNNTYNVVIIQTEEDRTAYYMSNAFKPPLGAAMVKGCFDGEDCSNVMAIRRVGESYNDAVSRVVQDEINDDTFFKKLSSSPSKAKKSKKAKK